MQQLWATKCSWDDLIPQPLMQKWHNYHTQLSHLRSILMPRWTEFGSDTSHYELHGFADASSVAYAAVVYLKVISFSGSVTVSLLIAKAKVAPLKPLTIPRLKLSTAVLLARTMSFVRLTLDLSQISLLDGLNRPSSLAPPISVSMENVCRASCARRANATSRYHMASCSYSSKSRGFSIPRNSSVLVQRPLDVVAGPRMAQALVEPMAG